MMILNPVTLYNLKRITALEDTNEDSHKRLRDGDTEKIEINHNYLHIP